MRIVVSFSICLGSDRFRWQNAENATHELLMSLMARTTIKRIAVSTNSVNQAAAAETWACG